MPSPLRRVTWILSFLLTYIAVRRAQFFPRTESKLTHSNIRRSGCMQGTSNIAVLYHRWSLKAFEVVSTRVILLWMISRSQLVARDWVGHVCFLVASFVLITRILSDGAFLLECRTSTKRLVLNLKASRHFVIQSEETPKAIVSRSYMFSRALHQFQVNAFDWFSGLPMSFMIGQSWLLVLNWKRL